MVPYRAKLFRTKVTKFFKSEDNVARPIVSPDKVSPNKIIKICLNDLFPM